VAKNAATDVFFATRAATEAALELSGQQRWSKQKTTEKKRRGDERRLALRPRPLTRGRSW
jgi:hypothetical protein